MRHLPTTLEGFEHRPLLTTETIVVEGLRRTGFSQCSLGIVPEGSKGRKVFQGPEVTGPWGFATCHPNIVDDSGMAAAERARAIRIHTGEPFTVEGLPGTWMLRSPKQFEGDGAKLSEYDADHPEAIEAQLRGYPTQD